MKASGCVYRIVRVLSVILFELPKYVVNVHLCDMEISHRVLYISKVNVRSSESDDPFIHYLFRYLSVTSVMKIPVHFFPYHIDIVARFHHLFHVSFDDIGHWNILRNSLMIVIINMLYFHRPITLP